MRFDSSLAAVVVVALVGLAFLASTPWTGLALGVALLVIAGAIGGVARAAYVRRRSPGRRETDQ